MTSQLFTEAGEARPTPEPGRGRAPLGFGCPLRTAPAVDSFRAVQNVMKAGSIAGAASWRQPVQPRESKTVGFTSITNETSGGTTKPGSQNAAAS